MNKIVFILVAAITFSAALAQAEQYRVVGIVDGDTVKVLSPDNRQMKCRLFGVEAPEKNQAYGQQSKQSLSDLIFQKTVDVNVVDQDQYGRSVCRIFLNGVDVNKVQVQRGLAWWHRRYSNDSSYGEAESGAKQQHLGLWADPNPVPPWSFRRNEKSKGFN